MSHRSVSQVNWTLTLGWVTLQTLHLNFKPAFTRSSSRLFLPPRLQQHISCQAAHWSDMDGASTGHRDARQLGDAQSLLHSEPYTMCWCIKNTLRIEEKTTEKDVLQCFIPSEQRWTNSLHSRGKTETSEQLLNYTVKLVPGVFGFLTVDWTKQAIWRRLSGTLWWAFFWTINQSIMKIISRLL